MPFDIDKDTILKFDRPGPRYTSYPTAPEWSDSVTPDTYTGKLRQFAQTDKTLSLYFHIPFCQSLCHYCACNVVIRQPENKHGDRYLDYLQKEIDLVTGQTGTGRAVRQLHWGGGTPTFLTMDQIRRLHAMIAKAFHIEDDAEQAIEVDPRTIDDDKLRLLKDVGFNRLSFGVQDFNPEVQEHVNRIQPFEQVEHYFLLCRRLDFASINFDLIYGLPGQTADNIRDTLKQVIQLRPDRIALYSFAHVPWLKKHQQKLDTEAMPSAEEKIDIFLAAREGLLNAGYMAIAMDHFALRDDEMARAYHDKTLYRNFMGYTVKPADEYLGLGMTAIGFVEQTFIQNVKTIPDYYAALDAGHLPVERGKVLTEDDSMRQWVIAQLMCHFEVDKEQFQKRFGRGFDAYFQEEQPHLAACINDELVKDYGDRLAVTSLGRLFVRNICMGFDWYLRQKAGHQKFSRTV